MNAGQGTRWTPVQISRIKPLVFVLCLYPLLRWIWLGWHHNLTANPPQFLILSSGIWALVLLLVTLAVTPVRRLLGQPALIGLRRMLGLFSFFYTVLHVIGWAWWERNLSLASMWLDITERTFIAVGVIATIPLLALALTSTRGWMRRLGSTWQTLHRTVYAIAALSVWHFWLVRAGKNDFVEPWTYGAILAALLAVRVIFAMRKKHSDTKRPRTRHHQK
ncbi:MAG TPA: protein-methionine-sulfoxide reductase heme-binding subunit MsrQ [Burkholderiaceae bacterium]|nr:protein-methionine-sulfoxide reductase heme-binding subunit MsrQ [Burkholderiaceae bacterium]